LDVVPLETSKLIDYCGFMSDRKPQNLKNKQIPSQNVVFSLDVVPLETSKLIDYCGFMSDRKPQNLKNRQIPS